MITSAGFVLAGTFAMMATLPLTTFTEIGFTVAFGVLLDTIIVRSVLVTALNLDWVSGSGGPIDSGEVRKVCLLPFPPTSINWFVTTNRGK